MPSWAEHHNEKVELYENSPGSLLLEVLMRVDCYEIWLLPDWERSKCPAHFHPCDFQWTMTWQIQRTILLQFDWTSPDQCIIGKPFDVRRQRTGLLCIAWAPQNLPTPPPPHPMFNPGQVNIHSILPRSISKPPYVQLVRLLKGRLLKIAPVIVKPDYVIPVKTVKCFLFGHIFLVSYLSSIFNFEPSPGVNKNLPSHPVAVQTD